ncbi:RecQ family zinc-binding domain-containing protein, partial [Vulcanococcus sp.]|uniref:RecQ family zinc-binding domain-containing protein n=1 Tax=Vulcanococcus sp. TaxID=2856995 RepID=UPI003C01171F
LVLHLDLPASAEGYLQESGRAGRDGVPARCIVLFDPEDRSSLAWAIRSSAEESGDPQDRTRAELSQQKLRRMEAVAEGAGCREQALLLSVGELVPPCGRCDRCSQAPRVRDWSEMASQVLEQLDQRSGVDLRSLGEDLAKAEGDEVDQWRWLARRLVQEDLISESDDGSQRLWLRPAGRRFLRQPWTLKLAA